MKIQKYGLLLSYLQLYRISSQNKQIFLTFSRQLIFQRVANILNSVNWIKYSGYVHKYNI